MLTFCRSVLPTGQHLSSPEGRHQSHQVPEGEGQGGQLQGETAAEEEEAPAAQLCILQTPTGATVHHRHVGGISWYLHSTVLSGES